MLDARFLMLDAGIIPFIQIYNIPKNILMYIGKPLKRHFHSYFYFVSEHRTSSSIEYRISSIQFQFIPSFDEAMAGRQFFSSFSFSVYLPFTVDSRTINFGIKIIFLGIISSSTALISSNKSFAAARPISSLNCSTVVNFGLM
jgi:hypothetical protein